MVLVQPSGFIAQLNDPLAQTHASGIQTHCSIISLIYFVLLFSGLRFTWWFSGGLPFQLSGSLVQLSGSLVQLSGSLV